MISKIGFILIFSSIGFFDTIILSYFELRKTNIPCLFFPKEWCKKLYSSPQSKIFGIPNSIAGLFIYTLILILTVLFLQGQAPFWIIQTVVSIGFCFSLYFLYLQAFVLRAFCPWCIISVINFIAMMFAAFLLR